MRFLLSHRKFGIMLIADPFTQRVFFSKDKEMLDNPGLWSESGALTLSDVELQNVIDKWADQNDIANLEIMPIDLAAKQRWAHAELLLASGVPEDMMGCLVPAPEPVMEYRF